MLNMQNFFTIKFKYCGRRAGLMANALVSGSAQQNPKLLVRIPINKSLIYKTFLIKKSKILINLNPFL